MTQPDRKAILEVCVDSVQAAALAAEAGADRIEFCSALLLGGLTPTLSSVRETRRMVGPEIDLVVMARPRAGDFVIDSVDLRLMADEIARCADAGADGIVCGVLKPSGKVDTAAMGRLLDAAGQCPVTFHRAIDQTPDLQQAATTLHDLGVQRILTSGGAGSAAEGLSGLKKLQSRYGDSMEIIAAGGVRSHNIPTILKETGIRSIHLSAATDRDGPAQHRPEFTWLGVGNSPAPWHRRGPDPKEIGACRELLER